MNWILKFFRVSSFDFDEIKVGSRVRTKYGSGVITSGSICVKYDEGTKLPNTRHENELTRCENLSKLEFI